MTVAAPHHIATYKDNEHENEEAAHRHTRAHPIIKPDVLMHTPKQRDTTVQTPHLHCKQPTHKHNNKAGSAQSKPYTHSPPQADHKVYSSRPYLFTTVAVLPHLMSFSASICEKLPFKEKIKV